jgi:leucine-rich repeat protein SHOC2
MVQPLRMGIFILQILAWGELKGQNDIEIDDSVLLSKIFTKPSLKIYYSIEEAIKNKDSVEYLSLLNNELEELPKNILLLKQLKVLNVSNNKLLYLPEWIDSLEHLEELHCRSNVITKLPMSICRLKKLKIIDLWNNKLASVPKCLRELKLQSLNFGSNSFNSIPLTVYNIVCLETLDFSNNNINNISMEISLMKSLREVNFSDNHLFQMPKEIKQLQSLEILYIGGNNFQEKTLNQLKIFLPKTRIFAN